MAEPTTLYTRLGGYDSIAAVADNLLPRLMADPELGCFWQHRSKDSLRREKQLLIDFICSCAGGPLLYVGRDMKISHAGMQISAEDWSAFMGHLNKTLGALEVPQQERDDVVAFIDSTRNDIVEC